MEVKEMLQINVTVIAGAFIFLSVSIVQLEESERELERLLNQTNQTSLTVGSERGLNINSHAFVAFLISFPFTVSSIVAVAAEGDKSTIPKANYERLVRGALLLMLLGFTLFMIVSMLVVFGVITFISD